MWCLLVLLWCLLVLLEDVFDPLDTPNPPSHEPYDAAMGYLGIGHVKAAYEKVVKSGDGLQLARLMEKTGSIIYLLFFIYLLFLIGFNVTC